MILLVNPMDSNQFQSREKKQERLIAVLLFLVFVLGGLLLVEKFSPGFSVWGSRHSPGHAARTARTGQTASTPAHRFLGHHQETQE